MAHRKHRKTEVKEDFVLNLIAMVDIMFLMLLFFMLSSDMSRRELAELVLPTADQVREDEKEKTDKKEHITTINVHHKPEEGGFTCSVNKVGGICREADHWLYAIRGKEFTKDTIKPQLKDEAEQSMETDVDPQAGKRMSARKVLIRADMAAPYGDVNKLIEYCGAAGMYKIEVAAAQPPKE